MSYVLEQATNEVAGGGGGGGVDYKKQTANEVRPTIRSCSE